jgi:hypothetical protein
MFCVQTTLTRLLTEVYEHGALLGAPENPNKIPRQSVPKSIPPALRAEIFAGCCQPATLSTRPDRPVWLEAAQRSIRSLRCENIVSVLQIFASTDLADGIASIEDFERNLGGAGFRGEPASDVPERPRDQERDYRDDGEDNY